MKIPFTFITIFLMVTAVFSQTLPVAIRTTNGQGVATFFSDSSGLGSINTGAREAFDNNSTLSIDWLNRTMNNNTGLVRYDWQQGLLFGLASIGTQANPLLSSISLYNNGNLDGSIIQYNTLNTGQNIITYGIGGTNGNGNWTNCCITGADAVAVGIGSANLQAPEGIAGDGFIINNGEDINFIQNVNYNGAENSTNSYGIITPWQGHTLMSLSSGLNDTGISTHPRIIYLYPYFKGVFSPTNKNALVPYFFDLHDLYGYATNFQVGGFDALGKNRGGPSVQMNGNQDNPYNGSVKASVYAFGTYTNSSTTYDGLFYGDTLGFSSAAGSYLMQLKLNSTFKAGITTGGSLQLLGSVRADAFNTQATTNDIFISKNDAAAANNAQQYSGDIHLVSQGWNSAGSTSERVDSLIQMRPFQQAGDPTGQLTFMHVINGGAVTIDATIDTTGNIAENTITVTNAPTFQKTNAAPSNVTIGVTAPDWWDTVTNNNGVQGFIPVWRNH